MIIFFFIDLETEAQIGKIKTSLKITFQNCWAQDSNQDHLTPEVIVNLPWGHGYERVQNCWPGTLLHMTSLYIVAISSVSIEML